MALKDPFILRRWWQEGQMGWGSTCAVAQIWVIVHISGTDGRVGFRIFNQSCSRSVNELEG